jgi:deazaflavin-dependent oxidoreductase (nitroreductase family)
MTHPTIPEGLPDWITKHLTQYYADPEQGHLWDSSPLGGKGPTPCLILTTTGRRSGRELPMPLIYGKSEDEFVIVASKGGAPQHPAWYLNLTAAPTVTVQVVADRFTATARTASGEERARLWKEMVEIYPPYAPYQTKTDREIPIVVLTRT